MNDNDEDDDNDDNDDGKGNDGGRHLDKYLRDESFIFQAIAVVFKVLLRNLRFGQDEETRLDKGIYIINLVSPWNLRA